MEDILLARWRALDILMWMADILGDNKCNYDYNSKTHKYNTKLIIQSKESFISNGWLNFNRRKRDFRIIIEVKVQHKRNDKYGLYDPKFGGSYFQEIDNKCYELFYSALKYVGCLLVRRGAQWEWVPLAVIVGKDGKHILKASCDLEE